ncbi:hypothetical protein A0H81_12949 [Grifola frondosa]|uniref:Uncharacterized protein n=1 Tax=Grifola frondosa TaxID=5627 RepID=A0A1C7LR95_GRIFR|nr:hypothetical protein A0H81_12949 [Grifola frondosa]
MDNINRAVCDPGVCSARIDCKALGERQTAAHERHDELEFGLSAFMSDKTQTKRGADWDSVGNDYRALRAMRPLLFLENASLATPKQTTGLPPLIVLHHILVRSPIPLPHTLHGWAEAEYVRWVNDHSEEEAWTLVEGDLSHWERIAEAEGDRSDAAAEYIQLARTVLANTTKGVV